MKDGKSKKINNKFDEEAERYFATKGSVKLWNYFLEISKTDYFQDRIKELRIKYKIPKNGFNRSECYTIPPDEWRVIHSDKIAELNIELENICKKYQLHYIDWMEVIENYLFYTKLNRIMHTNSYNLCLLWDILEDKQETMLEKQEGNYSDCFERSDDLAYPIAIRISPYASQRDIIDYIKKIFPIILQYQETYKKKGVKIGKVKTKNKSIQERNDLIYKNKDKTLKEIRRILANKNIFLDDGHIAKIISLEKQKRKDV
ncbi:MAG: hypothetical protein ABH830_04735 [Patescibacteria group bacterium]